MEISKQLEHIINLSGGEVSYKLDSDLNPYDISSYRDLIGGTPRILHADPKLYQKIIRDYYAATNANIGYDYLVRGEYFYETNRLSDSIIILGEAEKVTDILENPGILLPMIVVRAKTKIAMGNEEEALEILETYMDRFRRYNLPHWLYMLRALKALLLLNLGKLESAWEWAKESKLNVNQEVTRIREFELLVYARVFIGKKYYTKVIVLLKSLLCYAIKNNRLHSQVEILNLLAITELKSRNEIKSYNYIEKSLSIGLKEGYVRSFLDEFDAMRNIMELFLHKSRGNSKIINYAKKIKLMLDDEAEIQSKAELPTEIVGLTPAEHKILYFVVEGWNNENIAEELNITVRTVKAHTGNIYKKLNVKSRVECIIKARKIIR